MILPGWMKTTGAAVVLDVWVVPGAARTEVVGIHDGALRIRVAAPPEGGAANRALRRHLSRLTGGSVEIDRGRTSRRKSVRIEGVEPSAVVAALAPGSPP